MRLAFLRAAGGSSKRHNLQAVLLWMEGQESTEAFGFAFAPRNEYSDVLRTLTLKGKAFLRKLSNQFLFFFFFFFFSSAFSACTMVCPVGPNVVPQAVAAS